MLKNTDKFYQIWQIRLCSRCDIARRASAVPKAQRSEQQCIYRCNVALSLLEIQNFTKFGEFSNSPNSANSQIHQFWQFLLCSRCEIARRAGAMAEAQRPEHQPIHRCNVALSLPPPAHRGCHLYADNYIYILPDFDLSFAINIFRGLYLAYIKAH